jgi:uncharacterized protein DUF6894
MPYRGAVAGHSVTMQLMDSMKVHFNLANAHQTHLDEEGIEVSDLDEARTLALEAAAEMIQKGEAQIGDWCGWRMEAVDASGATLFTIRLDGLLN